MSSVTGASVKLLWSTQMFVADCSTLMASSSQPRNDRFRMMTLRSPLMLKPHPEMVAPELPMMVLFERTRSMPEQFKSFNPRAELEMQG